MIGESCIVDHSDSKLKVSMCFNCQDQNGMCLPDSVAYNNLLKLNEVSAMCMYVRHSVARGYIPVIQCLYHTLRLDPKMAASRFYKYIRHRYVYQECLSCRHVTKIGEDFSFWRQRREF